MSESKYRYINYGESIVFVVRDEDRTWGKVQRGNRLMFKDYGEPIPYGYTLADVIDSTCRNLTVEMDKAVTMTIFATFDV